MRRTKLLCVSEVPPKSPEGALVFVVSQALLGLEDNVRALVDVTPEVSNRIV